MRTERQMMDLILGRAKADPRVRAVILNGSRAVPSTPGDRFQDFDIVYVVGELGGFLAEPDWIDCFGARVMLQKPVEMDGSFNGVTGGVFNYLMLFRDGNRIDLTLCTPDTLPAIIAHDPVGVPLLDKDGMLKDAAFAGEELYRVRKPTRGQFENACNNFWWVLQNTAKGVARGELPYAVEMLNDSRAALTDMVCWHIGARSGWAAIPGKCGKYIGRYLEPERYRRYLATWPRADAGDIRRAMATACGLFRELGPELAGRFGYSYPRDDDSRMTAYIQTLLQIKEL